MGIIVKEAETVACIIIAVIAKHGIAQSAGLAYERHAAVAQRDHLTEAAGFKLRRHQEKVSTSIDMMRKRIVHLEACGHASMILLLSPAEQIDIAAFAHAQHYQLYMFFHDLADHVIDQIQAFLRGETADNTDHHGIGIFFQSQLTLQSAFAFCTAAHIIRSIIRSDHRVMHRIIQNSIDTIQHAGQMIPSCTEQPIQTLTEVSSLNLFSIAWADGSNLITIDKSRFHEVSATIAFQLVIGKVFVANAKHILDLLNTKDALILQIMDRIHSADIMIERVSIVLDTKQSRDHAALPVMRMQNFGLESQTRQHFETSSAEESKTLVFVTAHAIDIVPSEIILIINEIIGNTILLKSFYSAILATPAQLYIEVKNMVHLRAVFLRNGTVLGHHHTHIMSLGCQHGRQCADYVGQTAGFDEWYAFAGCKQNIHTQSLLAN